MDADTKINGYLKIGNIEWLVGFYGISTFI